MLLDPFGFSAAAFPLIKLLPNKINTAKESYKHFEKFIINTTGFWMCRYWSNTQFTTI